MSVSSASPATTVTAANAETEPLFFKVMTEIIVAGFVVVYFAMLCRLAIPMVVDKTLVELTVTSAVTLSLVCSLVVTALAVASSIYQFRQKTAEKYWEGALVLAVGLLVPVATFTMELWIWVFSI